MANDVITIPRKPGSNPAKNFDALRQEGIALLQQLGGDLWTDYNSHDPGVTILEALCYGITDLAFRTDFKVADLLTFDPTVTAAPLRNFYTLAEVATMKALTLNDYRRILADFPGIRNAWVEVSDENEVPIFLDEVYQMLSFSPASGERVRLGGLLNARIEFDRDERYGDLNDNSLILNLTIPMTAATLNMDFEFEFPIWEEVPAAFDAAPITTCDVDTIHAVPGAEFTHLVKFELNGTINPFPVYVRALTLTDEVPNLVDYQNALETVLDTSALVVTLMNEYRGKRAHVIEKLKKIREYLHQHRNLCEDFLHIYPMNVQEVGVCVELEIAPLADAERIFGAMMHFTERYLTPTIRFRSIRELKEMGRFTREIFEGPRLLHGFIDEQELREHQLRREIHTSDLLQLYMDIPGVVAVNKLSVSNYIKGIPLAEHEEDCVHLTSPIRFIPRLSIRRSCLKYERGDDFVQEADSTKARQHLSELRAQEGIRRNALTALDLPIPNGIYPEVEAYATLQEEFPKIYGIGSIGLPDNATTERRAQARQMKAFMLFFEQTLSNYLAQLSNLKRLFAFEESADNRTYYVQALYNIPEVQNLLKNFIDTYGTGWDQADWDAYQSTTSPYLQALLDISENEAGYNERRKRFLEHLAARFCEQFTDYALWLWGKNPLSAPETYLGDVSAFLMDYPAVSGERAAGFNYCFPETEAIWGSSNVTGVEKRVSLMLGFDGYTRTRVSELWSYIVFDNIGPGTINCFHLQDAGSTVTLTSIDYPDLPAAELAAMQAIIYLHDDNRWRAWFNTTDVLWEAQLIDETSTVIGLLSGFATEAEALLHIDTLRNFLLPFDAIEQFHVVEKILMRPKLITDPLLHVFLNPNCADPELVAQWGEMLPDDENAAVPQYTLDPPPRPLPPVRGGTGNVIGQYGNLGPAYNNEGGGGSPAPNGRQSGPRVPLGEAESAEGQYMTEEEYLDANAESPFTNTVTVEPAKPEICDCCDCLMVKDPYSFRVCIIAPDWTPRFSDPSFRKLFRKTVRQELPAHIFANFYFLNRLQMRYFENAFGDWLWWNASNANVQVGNPEFDDVESSAMEILISGCDALCNGYDAHYEMATTKKTNVYEIGDVMAYLVDADGHTVDARLATGSSLPPGLVLHPFTGDIIVENPALLTPGANYNFEVHTWNSSGERHCHQVSITHPQDQEAVCVHFDNKFINQFTDGEPLLQFSDPDGDIVEANWNPTVSVLPPGCSFNAVTGEILVVDADALVAGTYPIQVTTIDEDGGITSHTCSITLRNDRPALGISYTGCSLSRSLVRANMHVAKISDLDGGVAGVGPVTTNWTLLGLRMEFEPGIPFTEANFYIDDLQTYLDYIQANNIEGAGSQCRKVNLDVLVTDVQNGQTTVTLSFAYRVDNPAAANLTTPQNIFTYQRGDSLGTIVDALDGGILGFSGDEEFAEWGLSANRVGNSTSGDVEISLRVDDPEVFRQRAMSEWGEGTGTYNRTFELLVTDKTGTETSLSFELSVLQDGPPSQTPGTMVAQDALTAGTVLSSLAYSGAGGMADMTSYEPFWSAEGFEVSMSYDPITETLTAQVIVGNPTLMRAGLYQNWARDEANRRFGRVVVVQTTNGVGGKHQVPVQVWIEDRITATHRVEYQGQRPDQMPDGTVLLRWHSTVPSGVSVTAGALPPGTALEYDSYEVRLVVADQHDLFPDAYSFTLTGNNVTGSSISQAFSLTFPERIIQHSILIPWTLKHAIDFESIYADLGTVVVDEALDERYGLVEVGDVDIRFSLFKRFERHIEAALTTFTAVVTTNSDEPVTIELSLQIMPEPFSAMLQSRLHPYAGMVEASRPEVKAVLAQAKAYMEQLDALTIFAMQEIVLSPSLSDEWAAYRSGARNHEPYDLLGLKEAAELARALAPAAHAVDVQALMELRVLGVLLGVQTEALIFFATEIVEDDLETGNELDLLFHELDGVLRIYESY